MNSMNFTLGPFSADSFFNLKSGAGTLELYPFIGHLTIYLLLNIETHYSLTFSPENISLQ